MVTAVTGASGFVGNVLVRTLLDRGDDVRAVDLVRGRALDDLDVAFTQADVLDPASLEVAFRGADVVYHLAAMISVTGDPSGRVWAVNVDGVENAARAAVRAGIDRFVHCSSVHAYDLEQVSDRVTEDSPAATADHLPVYDRSKAAGEEALRNVVDAGLDAVICNPTAVIGPYDYQPSRMGAVFRAMFRRRLPALVDGRFDWVDVRDVAASLIAAGEKGQRGSNYLLPGHFLSLRELVTTAHVVAGAGGPRVTVPMWFARIWSPLANAAGRRTGNPLWYTTESLHALRFATPVSGERAARHLGHAPRPIEDTMADIHRWFSAQNPVRGGAARFRLPR